MKTGLEATIATLDWERDDMVGWVVKCPAGKGYIWDVSATDKDGNHTVLVRLSDTDEIKRFPASEVFEVS